MLTEALADGLWAYRLGQVMFDLVLLIAGALLLIVGIRRRRTYDRWVRNEDVRFTSEPDRDLAADDDEFDPRLRDDYDPDYDPDDDEDLGPRQLRTPGKGTVLIVLGALFLLLGTKQVITGLIPPRIPQAEGGVVVGQCITAQTYDQGHMNSEPVDCDQSDATMELASDGDATASCPDGKRAGTTYPALTNAGRTQCFILNLRENQCYALARTATVVTCTNPAANVRVDRRIDGTSAANGCSAQSRVVAYPEPQRVYCLVAP